MAVGARKELLRLVHKLRGESESEITCGGRALWFLFLFLFKYKGESTTGVASTHNARRRRT